MLDSKPTAIAWVFKFNSLKASLMDEHVLGNCYLIRKRATISAAKISSIQPEVSGYLVVLTVMVQQVQLSYHSIEIVQLSSGFDLRICQFLKRLQTTSEADQSRKQGPGCCLVGIGIPELIEELLGDCF